MTREAIACGIQRTSWPGRLSFHRLGSTLVLADGAHNPASARTLAAYITSTFSSHSEVFASAQPAITFLVALSHSPPKSPLETLAPLLSLPANIGVAPLQFTPPDGMPWVRPETSSTLRDAVAELAPQAELWEPGDVQEENPLALLRFALKWAAERHKREGLDGLVVVAGSLYLVADFYRLLEREGKPRPRESAPFFVELEIMAAVLMYLEPHRTHALFVDLVPASYSW